MTAEQLLALSNAYGTVAAAEAARKIGLFDYLKRGAQHAETLIAALGLEPRTALGLLGVLHTVGVLTVDAEGRFSIGDAGGVVDALHLWDALPLRLTSPDGARRRPSPEAADRFYPGVVRAMADAQEELAMAASAKLRGFGKDVLDVGAGAAPWSLALARTDPAFRITLVDRPGVLAVARARVTAAGCSAQFNYVAADIEHDGFGEKRHDLALVGNVCHLFGDEQNTRLFERVHASLRPGGTLAIIDSTPEDYATVLDEKLHALSLALRTEAGEVHSFSRYSAWLSRTGFVDIEHERVGGKTSVSVMRGRRTNA